MSDAAHHDEPHASNAEDRDAGRYQRKRGIALTIPRVNLNGTSRKELLRQYGDAIVALNSATQAVQEAWPHGRDYQTMNPEAHRSAMEQHQTRLGMLEAIADELSDIHEGVYQQ